jgi:ABC-type nitrate/sulfonate/bicarbonate transport system substrate-binding protein
MSGRRRVGSRAGWRALVSALALLLAAGRAGPQAVKIRGGSSLSPPTLDAIAPYVANERGLFRKYGLEVEVVAFRGGSTT